MLKKNMTIRLLADLCGVSKSTIGMALRNDPRVAAKTRIQIKACAAKHGYKADPRVSHLMALLKRGRRKAIWNIAWINSAESHHAWTSLPWLSGYLKGSRRRAEELGYDIDQIWIHDQTPKQLAKVLRARGIQGLLIPFPEQTEYWSHFPWDQFSAVVVDEFDVKLSLPHVISDRHSNMRLVLDELENAGFRKPALWLQDRLDEIRNTYSSAFLGWHHKRERRQPLLWSFNQQDPTTLRRKINSHRPDVIICCHNGTLECLHKAGFLVPEYPSLVHLNLAADVPNWSGIDQKHESIGFTGVDVLNTLLIKGETGLHRNPQTILVPGIWKSGQTVSGPVH